MSVIEYVYCLAVQRMKVGNVGLPKLSGHALDLKYWEVGSGALTPPPPGGWGLGYLPPPPPSGVQGRGPDQTGIVPGS